MAARTLKLTSPPMHGEDVKAWQRTLNRQLAMWKVNHKIKVDGDYGVLTRDTGDTVLHGMGIAQKAADKGYTPWLRSKVRRRRRTPAELVRFNARKDWREALRKRYDGRGPQAALSWARAQIGTKEQPPGSNRGPLIDQWQRLCQVFAAPWCGCFVNRALMAAGFPAQPWLRFCPWIEQKAKAGEGGWSWHSEPRAGDLILYGAREAQHVGIVDDPSKHSTVEGNTSSGNAGSQDNGGMVAARMRDWSSPGFPVRGFARPPWGSVK